MSAYMVGKNHIKFLVEAARSRAILGDGDRLRWYHAGDWRDLPITDYARASEIGQMLWDENVKSINARYPDTKNNMGQAPADDDSDPAYIYGRHNACFTSIDPAQVIHSCRCYEYQSCEHDGWEASEAHAFIKALRDAASNALCERWAKREGIELKWGAPEPTRRCSVEAPQHHNLRIS